MTSWPVAIVKHFRLEISLIDLSRTLSLVKGNIFSKLNISEIAHDAITKTRTKYVHISRDIVKKPLRHPNLTTFWPHLTNLNKDSFINDVHPKVNILDHPPPLIHNRPN